MHHDTEQVLLAALHADPADETAWLALADALEENDQPDRAALVRLTQQLRSMPVMRRTRSRAALEERLAGMLLAGVRPVVPELVNSLDMRFALVPPGLFRMGSPSNESQRDKVEGPTHEVEITRPFYLGIFPVTQGQFIHIMGHNPSFFSATGTGKDRVTGLNTADFPVENVSWAEAVVFCQRLSELPAEQAAGRTYRLPTEAEWEYACRGGACSTGPFAFGESMASSQANFNGIYPYPVRRRARGDYLERTCGVGSYPPNAFGLYDMHGNVWEWCHDWFDGGYYHYSERQDPIGPPHGELHVLRGGSWQNAGESLRSARRVRNGPVAQMNIYGFRMALNHRRVTIGTANV